MTRPTVGAVTAAFLLTLVVGCAGGDLTLPGPNGSGGDGGPGPHPPGQPVPAVIVAADGDGQSAEPGALLADPLVVQVLDSTGTPVAGLLIAFSFQGDPAGAALDPSSVLTDTAGRAAATVRLGDAPGEQIVVASVASSRLPDLRASFSLTAVPPDDPEQGKKDRHHHHDD
jgi:hypothetical protein